MHSIRRPVIMSQLKKHLHFLRALAEALFYDMRQGEITKEAVKPLPLGGGYKAIGGTPIKAAYLAVRYTV